MIRLHSKKLLNLSFSPKFAIFDEKSQKDNYPDFNEFTLYKNCFGLKGARAWGPTLFKKSQKATENRFLYIH